MNRHMETIQVEQDLTIPQKIGSALCIVVMFVIIFVMCRVMDIMEYGYYG